ncbi:hypothetical protein Zmor_006913 [Zophobas morio]|uniref:Peptidoglycan recognition protein family domain-containing protein n=1 Tax=Zophobas morio TaxID=2755281 RepID=A0AA38MN31_9CUCU|nr:hypothetical protein Zmor_006913 [Zophobas morio]
MSASELRRPILGNNNRNQSYSVQDNIDNGQASFLSKICRCAEVGLVIGTYLLVTEGHEWKDSRVYNLTSRELWKAHVASSTMPKLKLPVQRVLFLQTNSSSSCDGKSHCAKLVQELQCKHMNEWKLPDIIYNFVITTDGTIFEGRGWNFQTDLSIGISDNAIAIGFLDNFRFNSSTIKQIESLKLFLNTSVLDRKLERCVKTEIWGDRRILGNIVKKIKESWSRCDIT